MNEEFITPEESAILIHNFKQCRDHNLPESYSIIKNILSLWEIPFPVVTVPKGKILYRCRRHTKDEETLFFGKIEDISYRKDIFRIRSFGRVNEPIQSIFYSADDYEVAFLETSITSREDKDIEQEIITTGKWIVEKEFGAANLIVKEYQDNLHQINPTVKEFFKQFQEWVKTGNVQKELIDILHFFSEEFRVRSPDNKYYKTSAAFANYVYSSINENNLTALGGIIYPSAIQPSKGMNLAFPPELVDQGYLKLIEVRKSVMKQIKPQKYKEVETYESIKIDSLSGKIDWPLK